MSAASKRDAMEALTEAFRKHYGDDSAMCGHIEAYHLRNSLMQSRYNDYWGPRDSSDWRNWERCTDGRWDMKLWGTEE